MADNQSEQKEVTTKEVTTKEVVTSTDNQENKITPMRCFTGGAISGVLVWGSYLLTKSIVFTYATTPIKFNNPIAVNIASTVRTLIMGITTLATFIFLMVTIGLLALGVKLIIEGKKLNQT